MKILDLLKGKKIKVMTDLKVEVTLEIKEVKEQPHSVDVGPSNRENDWWPPTRDWVTFDVTFTNGVTKSYSSLGEINIIEE